MKAKRDVPNVMEMLTFSKVRGSGVSLPCCHLQVWARGLCE